MFIEEEGCWGRSRYRARLGKCKRELKLGCGGVCCIIIFCPEDGTSSIPSRADPERGIGPCGPSKRLFGMMVGIGTGPAYLPSLSSRRRLLRFAPTNSSCPTHLALIVVLDLRLDVSDTPTLVTIERYGKPLLKNGGVPLRASWTSYVLLLHPNRSKIRSKSGKSFCSGTLQ